MFQGHGPRPRSSGAPAFVDSHLKCGFQRIQRRNSNISKHMQHLYRTCTIFMKCWKLSIDSWMQNLYATEDIEVGTKFTACNAVNTTVGRAAADSKAISSGIFITCQLGTTTPDEHGESDLWLLWCILPVTSQKIGKCMYLKHHWLTHRAWNLLMIASLLAKTGVWVARSAHVQLSFGRHKLQKSYNQRRDLPPKSQTLHPPSQPHLENIWKKNITFSQCPIGSSCFMFAEGFHASACNVKARNDWPTNIT